MRRIIRLLVGILVALFVLLSLLDKSDYALEKRLWRIKKDFNVVAADPQIVSGQKFRDVVNSYEVLIKEFPHSEEIPVVLLQVGRMYVLKKDWREARKVFQVILGKYPKAKDFCGLALLEIGRTYEAEGNSAAAIETYRQILFEYPMTEIGLDTPVHIIDYYKNIGQPQKAAEATKEAIDFYQRIAEKSTVPYNRFRVLRKLAAVYVVEENWPKALEILEYILMELPNYKDIDRSAAEGVIKSINSVAVLQLKDYDRPIMVYRAFIRQNPQHDLTPKVQELISALEQLKEQNTSQ